MKQQSKLKSIFRTLDKLNEKYTIKVTIPIRVLIPAVLIIMALTGKIGAAMALLIAIFLVFVLMWPDDYSER